MHAAEEKRLHDKRQYQTGKYITKKANRLNFAETMVVQQGKKMAKKEALYDNMA